MSVYPDNPTVDRILRSLPAAVAVLEGPVHIFRYHNDQYRRLVGASSTLVGLTVAAALPNSVGREIARQLDNVYRTGHPWLGTEVEVLLAEGDVRYVNAAYVARRDAAGDVDGVIVHVVDVTELVSARKQGLDLVNRLAIERARLHQVIEQLETGVVIADADGRLLLVNNAWREAFAEVANSAEGIEGIQGIGDYRVFVGYRPDGRQYEPEELPIARALLTGEEVQRERIRFAFGDGTERILDVSAVRLPTATDDPAQALASTIDMTDQLRLQHELATQQEQEAQRRAEADRRRAYEINDTVLQRLAVADLAFSLGQEEDARTALREALAITKRLISEWGSEAEDLSLSSVFRRDEAADRG